MPIGTVDKRKSPKPPKLIRPSKTQAVTIWRKLGAENFRQSLARRFHFGNAWLLFDTVRSALVFRCGSDAGARPSIASPYPTPDAGRAIVRIGRAVITVRPIPA